MMNINGLIGYFDLQSGSRSPRAIGTSGGGAAMAPVSPQYFAVAAGVIVEPFLRHYMASGTWQLDWRSIVGRAVFGLMIAVILLPAVYKSAFDPSKPMLVQLAALFPMGIGWQSLVASSTKLAAGT